MWREVRRQRLAVALRGDAIDECVERHATLLLARPATAYRDRLRRRLLVANDEHVAGLALLRFLHAIAQVPRLLVEMHAEAPRAQARRRGARVVERRLAHRDDRELLPRQPEREVPGVMLDEAADESLEAAEEDAMDHHRALALAALVHERDVEALRQVQVDLDRGALPLAADRVLHLDVDLRRVEDAAALVDLVGDLAHAERLAQRALGLVPHLVGAEPLLRPRREIDDRIGVAEGAQELHREVEDLPDLVLRLRGRAEDVRVVLREAAHALHPVERAAALVAVHRAELADAQRQLAVRVDLRLVDLDVTRAVHRLDPEALRAFVEHE